jgi:hypothetical protein
MNDKPMKRYGKLLPLLLLAGAMGCELSRNNIVANPPTSNPIDTATTITVGMTVAPTEATIAAGQTKQFFATVTGSANTAVTWTVASGPGTVDSNGVFAAPSAIDADTVQAVVKAVANADTTVSATASIKIGKPAPVGTPCDTANVTYAAVVKPILQLNCYGCHSGANPPQGLNLSLYNSVRAVANNGKLYGAITHARGFPAMPKGANKLDDCTIAKIKAWIGRGAPND